MRFHREGNLIIPLVVLFVLLLNGLLYHFLGGLAWWQYLLLVGSVGLIIFVVQFFRHPARNTPSGEGIIVAPADGKVVVIEETEETEFLGERRIQISIFMSPLNVHVNRAPITGALKYFKYHPGKYLVAWHPKSSTDNERTTLVMEDSRGKQVLFRQIAGAMARRIRWYVGEGDRLKQGEEFGFIRFGSRVDVFVPLDARIEVSANQKTRGGETVLARW